ncbi:MAG: hypothetical protein P4M12_09455 [Gammaproteobacteria bacterium]|nr:hypothetical protein [Gammaproteobacteria bacterium]
MRNQLFVFSAAVLLASLGSFAYAENLDADTIKTIHESVKASLIDKCKSKMVGATDKSCTCLGEKASNSLDDVALGKCANDEAGGPCITAIVSAATTKGLSADNIAKCAHTTPATTSSVKTTNMTSPDADNSDTNLPPAPAPILTSTDTTTTPAASSNTAITPATAPKSTGVIPVTSSNSSTAIKPEDSANSSPNASPDTASTPDDDEFN